MELKKIVFWDKAEIQNILERKEMISIKWLTITEKGIEAELK